MSCLCVGSVCTVHVQYMLNVGPNCSLLESQDSKINSPVSSQRFVLAEVCHQTYSIVLAGMTTCSRGQWVKVFCGLSD